MAHTNTRSRLLALIGAAALAASFAAPAAAVQPADGAPKVDPTAVAKTDNRADPLTSKQLERKATALEAKLNGKAYGKVGEVARGQYVELARMGEGALWTVLGEFADLEHNAMPMPDRAVDNTTIWEPDFNRAYYLDLLFDDAPGANSMRTFYVEQSANRYTVHGDVSDWVPVPGAAATYDDDFESPQGGNQVWYFLKDSVNSWYAAQVAAGKTPAQINAYLAQFDVWDRYDHNGNGNFDEPDGYIDTFQSVHAGPGNEACSPDCDDWAIWSHSWYAFYGDIGHTGPAFNQLGGFRVGDSDLWIGKYTIQPEDGGLGAFVHEYGHDLGLPDLYDYYELDDGVDVVDENGTAFWTLMSDGAWLDDGLDTIGNKSSHMGAWEKFQLGWLNYEVAFAGARSVHKLGPMEFNTKQAQGLFVILPEKSVTTEIGEPYAGSHVYYSGSGNDLDNSMTRSVALPVGASLSAMVNYQIELDWDYAYLTVNGTPVDTNLSTDTNPNGQNFGHGITGSSGDAWVALTADLSAWAGQTVSLGFRYWTDGAVVEQGLMIDEIAITSFPTDGAEADAGWTFAGFRVSTGTEAGLFSHYYVIEYRTYKGYDRTLRTGPYYHGYLDDPELGAWVDHFAYQDGMLVNYWDTSQADNNTALHPGSGLLLPVDAHFATLYRADGVRWRNRIQSYDSTFTLDRTDGIPGIHHDSIVSPVPSLPAVRVFDDRELHYAASNPLGSVIHPNTGTQIRIQSLSAQNSFMQVEVTPAR